MSQKSNYRHKQNACSLIKRKRSGNVSREEERWTELGEVEGRDTVDRLYCMTEESVFSEKIAKIDESIGNL